MGSLSKFMGIDGLAALAAKQHHVIMQIHRWNIGNINHGHVHTHYSGYGGSAAAYEDCCFI